MTTTDKNNELKERNINESNNNFQLEKKNQDFQNENNIVKNLEDFQNENNIVKNLQKQLEEALEFIMKQNKELNKLSDENRDLYLNYQNLTKYINKLTIQIETLSNEMKQILNVNSLKTIFENYNKELLKQINESNMKLYNEFHVYHQTNILNQQQNQINCNKDYHQNQNGYPPMEYDKDNSKSKNSSISNPSRKFFNYIFPSSNAHPNQIISTNKKEIKYKLYYFSEDMEYFNTIKSLLEESPVFIQDINERIILNVEKGPIANSTGVDEACDGNSKLFALYSIFSSGARSDWDKYKNSIENLQKNNYNVALVLIRSGKNATPFIFENFKGTQINLKGLKGDLYHDDFNLASLKTLCKSIHQSK